MKSRVSPLAPLAFLVVLLTSAAAPAQDDQNYPARPIHVIVGPGPDLTARILGQKVEEVLGQGVVIEARPGAPAA